MKSNEIIFKLKLQADMEDQLGKMAPKEDQPRATMFHASNANLYRAAAERIKELEKTITDLQEAQEIRAKAIRDGLVRIKELEQEITDNADHVMHADAYQKATMDHLERVTVLEAALKPFADVFRSGIAFMRRNDGDPNEGVMAIHYLWGPRNRNFSLGHQFMGLNHFVKAGELIPEEPK